MRDITAPCFISAAAGAGSLLAGVATALAAGEVVAVGGHTQPLRGIGCGGWQLRVVADAHELCRFRLCAVAVVLDGFCVAAAAVQSCC